MSWQTKYLEYWGKGRGGGGGLAGLELGFVSKHWFM